MDSYNATSTAMSSLPTALPMIGPVLAIVIFIAIIGILFLMYKNFRIFCLGLVVLVPSSIIGSLSWYISKQTTTGNTLPITILAWAVGISLISMLIGFGLSKTPWGKKMIK